MFRRSLLVCFVAAIALSTVHILADVTNDSAEPVDSLPPIRGGHGLPIGTSKFTHPETLTFPMTRSLSATKTTQKAAAGDVHAQRLYNAMAHGFADNREAVQQQNAAGRRILADSPSPSTFYGCPFADFVIPVIIGSNTFQLIVDTGSSTLAVAGSSCTNCKSGTAVVSPVWSATNGVSVNQNSPASGSYGDQSGWLGEIWSDKVSLSLTSGSSTSQVTQRIVVITSSSQSGVDASGNAAEGAQPFFVKNPCNDATTDQKKQIFAQGIIGVAYQALAATNTDSFMVKLFEQYPSLPKTYALQMCEYSGNLWVGGLDTTSYSGNMLTVPVMHHTGTPELLFFSIAPQKMYIKGKELSGITSASWDQKFGQIVDSGTTYWSLPSPVYRAVVDAIIADPGFQLYFRHSATDNFFDQPDTVHCETALLSPTTATLQSALPTISIQLTNGVTLTMDGVGSYMMPCSQKYNSWTAGIVDGGPVRDDNRNYAIGGWSLMNQFIVNHDLANNQLSFAPSTACATGVKPLNAKVEQGTPTAASSSTGTTSSTATTSSSSTSSSGASSSSGSSSSSGVKNSAASLQSSTLLQILLAVLLILVTRH